VRASKIRVVRKYLKNIFNDVLGRKSKLSVVFSY
jgi:hypothetical protein